MKTLENHTARALWCAAQHTLKAAVLVKSTGNDASRLEGCTRKILSIRNRTMRRAKREVKR